MILDTIITALAVLVPTIGLFIAFLKFGLKWI